MSPQTTLNPKHPTTAVWRSHQQFDAARTLPAMGNHGQRFYICADCPVDKCSDQDWLLDVQSVAAQFDLKDFTALFPSEAVDDRFVLAQLLSRLPNCNRLELSSRTGQHIIWHNDKQYLKIEDDFCAAHQLPNVPEGHQCGRLHGHTFSVSMTCLASGISHQDLWQSWQTIKPMIHNQYLNAITGLDNPTSENLADWLWHQLESQLPLTQIQVKETMTAASIREADGFTIWKEQYFEAALPLQHHFNRHDSHNRALSSEQIQQTLKQQTGHSYLIRLLIDGQPDHFHGWIKDFADIKSIFNPIYKQLDHHDLQQTLFGQSPINCNTIAQWVAQQLQITLPELSGVHVFESTHLGAPKIGALYHLTSPIEE